MLHVVKKRQFAPELNQKRINHRFVTFKNTTTTVRQPSRKRQFSRLSSCGAHWLQEAQLDHQR